jgi:hypothetical protein
VKSDSLEKNEFLKKTRAPLPPVSSPQRPKLPAPQLPTVISPRQQQQESPPPRVESPPVESQPAIDQLKETPDTKTQFSSPVDSTRDSAPVQQSTAQSQELVEPKLNSPTYSPISGKTDQSLRKKNIAPQPSIPDVVPLSTISDCCDTNSSCNVT